MIRFVLFLCLAVLSVLTPICRGQTPFFLLRSDSPADIEKAIQLMRDDRGWIARRDLNKETLLHVAADQDQFEIVLWLLENGADVNAQAYNSLTPLHLTENPEIVRLILSRKPNLQLSSTSGTPLQVALERLRNHKANSEQRPSEKKKASELEEIVKLYIEYLGHEIDLTSAIRLGRIEAVRKILSTDPSAAHGSSSGMCPLREASRFGQLDICKFLIDEHQVDVNDFEGYGGYPIIKDALKFPTIVELLVENGADLTTRITFRGVRTGVWIIGDNATALHFAASDGVPETIKILLDSGIDPFAVATDGTSGVGMQTALEVAAIFGRTDNAIAILEHPEFKNSDDTIRRESLDRAMLKAACSSWLARESQDRAELLEALIVHGANVLATEDEQSVVQIAVSCIQLEYSKENVEHNESIKRIVSVLKKHGAKLDVCSAVAVGDFESLGLLLATDPGSADSCLIDGEPALHMAIKVNSPQAARILLDAGCDPEIKTKTESSEKMGETPLFSAVFWGREEIVKLLVARGAAINSESENQSSPLHAAVRMNRLDIAKLLLENGADKNAKDGDGKTPIEHARDKDRLQEFAKLFSGFPQEKK